MESVIERGLTGNRMPKTKLSKNKNYFVQTDYDEKYLETQNQCYWKNVFCSMARSNRDENENLLGEGHYIN